ncbi:hypothetical protein [Desulfobulbus oralis]|uniref:Uncharacterized protein n=1 Tax=Desulfobulbus oralis TaxID=1986146 RepID=A0A2L1GPN3_9BACT|nr:hypothetical protein [Desulfobulbus oralis]AVD71640.1 hypothetical protein CAY53_09300 [Desulfobulbus oralis]
MAFVNEWISEEDMEKYHIREIREKMVADRGRPDWVRDRERDMYLMQVNGLGRDNEYETWLLYARGKYAAVRMYRIGGDIHEDKTEDIRWCFQEFDKGLFCPFPEPPREELPAMFRLLEEALSVYGRRGIRYSGDLVAFHVTLEFEKK